jgi:hypothetical protein
MNPPSQDLEAAPDAPHRYFPHEAERLILTRAIFQYQAAHERSPERNQIAAETAQELNALEQHEWDPRSVRIWFNNNHDSICPHVHPPENPPHVHTIPANPSLPRAPDSPVVYQDILDLQNSFADVLKRLASFADTVEKRYPCSKPYIRERTAVFLAKGGLPISRARSPALRRFVQDLHPGAPATGVAKVRETILQLAQDFIDHVTPENQGFRFVHLMNDTVSLFNRHFLGVCLVTLNNFFPWAVVEIENQTADHIAAEMSIIIQDLQERGFTPLGVVTDNASAEIASVELLIQDYSVFRVPCLSHTANLVIGDFFEECFPGRDVFKQLRKLINALPRRNNTERFYGCPSLTETRWFCLWDLFRYVLDNYDRINDFLRPGPKETKAHFAARKVFQLYDFRGILPFLEVIGRFIKWTEDENSTLGMAWPIVGHIHDFLTQLVARGVPYAAEFLNVFTKRITKSADLPHMLLAYLMTRDGLKWYQNLDVQVFGEHRVTQDFVKVEAGKVLTWFGSLMCQDPERFAEIWNHYLQISPDDFGHCGKISFWKRMCSTEINIPGRGRVLCEALGILGIIMGMMPVSESGVERIFSHLRDMLLVNALSMGSDLIQARLLVKLNAFPDAEFSQARLAELDAAERRSEESIVPAIALPVPELQPGRYSAARL